MDSWMGDNKDDEVITFTECRNGHRMMDGVSKMFYSACRFKLNCFVCFHTERACTHARLYVGTRVNCSESSQNLN